MFFYNSVDTWQFIIIIAIEQKRFSVVWVGNMTKFNSMLVKGAKKFVNGAKTMRDAPQNVYLRFKAMSTHEKILSGALLLAGGIMLDSCQNSSEPVVIDRNSYKYGAVFERDSAGVPIDTVYVPDSKSTHLDLSVARSGRDLNGDTTATVHINDNGYVSDTTLTFGDHVPIGDYTYRLLDIEKPRPDGVDVYAVGTVTVGGQNNGRQAIPEGTSHFAFSSNEADSTGSNHYSISCTTYFPKVFEGYRNNMVFSNDLISSQPVLLQPGQDIRVGDGVFFIMADYMARFDRHNPPAVTVQFEGQKQTVYCDSSDQARISFSGSDTLAGGMVKSWVLSGTVSYPTTVPLVAMFAYGDLTYSVVSVLGPTSQERSGGLEKEYGGPEIVMTFGGKTFKLVSISNPAEGLVKPEGKPTGAPSE